MRSETGGQTSNAGSAPARAGLSCLRACWPTCAFAPVFGRRSVTSAGGPGRALAHGPNGRTNKRVFVQRCGARRQMSEPQSRGRRDRSEFVTAWHRKGRLGRLYRWRGTVPRVVGGRRVRGPDPSRRRPSLWQAACASLAAINSVLPFPRRWSRHWPKSAAWVPRSMTLVDDGILFRPKEVVDRNAAADRIAANFAAAQPQPGDLDRSENEIMTDAISEIDDSRRERRHRET